MEAHIEEPAQRDEPMEHSTPVASPKSPIAPAPTPSPPAQSPGLGSGTKENDDEVQITGLKQNPVTGPSTAMAKVTTSEVKPATAAKGKDPVPLIDLPALDSMSTSALVKNTFLVLLNTRTWKPSWSL